MKQRDLVKKLMAGGFVLDHHGSNHDIYRRGEDEFETVERYKEIPERLAKAILKRRGLK